MAVWACEIDDDDQGVEEWREEKRVVSTMNAATQSPVFGCGKRGDMDDSKEGRRGCYCQASLKEFQSLASAAVHWLVGVSACLCVFLSALHPGPTSKVLSMESQSDVWTLVRCRCQPCAEVGPHYRPRLTCKALDQCRRRRQTTSPTLCIAPAERNETDRRALEQRRQRRETTQQKQQQQQHLPRQSFSVRRIRRSIEA